MSHDHKDLVRKETERILSKRFVKIGPTTWTRRKDFTKIMIMDDSVDFRFILKEKVRKVIPDAEIFFAGDGVHGLQVLEKHKPDLVLSDLQMPRADGDEFIERARASGFTGPVILISGAIWESRNKAMFTKAIPKTEVTFSREFFEELGFTI